MHLDCLAGGIPDGHARGEFDILFGMTTMIIAGLVGLVLGGVVVWFMMKAVVNGAMEKFAVTSHQQLKENSAEFSVQSLKSLEPLMRDIREFREKVEGVNKEAIARTAEMKGQIKSLLEQSERMSGEANELASAIRGDSQVIGAWGEIQLKRVLERAGLQENVHYTYQETFASEDSLRKDLRTDVLVKMPGNRLVVIDSKNTVAAYVAYQNTTDEQDASRLKDEILRAAKKHVDELRAAQYGKNIKGALSQVLAFIPFEEVYLMALKGEVTVNGERRSLFDYAWESDVILVNATMLIPVLRLIEMMWQGHDADKKAQKIIEEAEGLCNKFRIVLESYKTIGKNLATLTASYNDCAKSMADGKGNLLKRFQNLSNLGVGLAKDLPQEEEILDAARKIPEVM